MALLARNLRCQNIFLKKKKNQDVFLASKHGVLGLAGLKSLYGDHHNYSTSRDAIPGQNFLSIENELRCREYLMQKVQYDVIRTEAKGLSGRVNVPTLLEKKVKRHAGILVPFCIVNDKPSLLYTLRTTTLSSHRGEISFPGGVKDKNDDDLIATALRETTEEIGIDPTTVDVWGYGASVPNANMTMLVTPVIANCGVLDLNDLKLNLNEVEEVFVVPLEEFCRSDSWRYTRFVKPNAGNPNRGASKGSVLRIPSFVLPVYLHGDRVIWGLTAIMTYLNIVMIAGNEFKFKLPPR